MKVASAAAPGAILVPKVDSAEQVQEVEALMKQHGAPDSVGIWCMMETPIGVLSAKEIAGASPRVRCLVMGTSDLTKDLHAHHTQLRLPMLTSLGLCLLAARAHDLSILDGVYLDLDDAEGFRASCAQGLELGFDGKTLIHPKQVEAANEVFAPTEQDVTDAREIIEAHKKASAEGAGVVVVKGKLVESLHVANAERLVALAEAIRG